MPRRIGNFKQAVQSRLPFLCIIVMLWHLRERAVETENAGHNPEAVKRASVILKDEAASIGAFNGLDGQSFFPGPGGEIQSRIQADLRQTRIDEVRKHIAETLSALGN